ncbi:alpha-L-fucosidase C-terminal domain-containing protein, partial [Flavitalea sp.]|nr:alpha-L-fucosidase C-terminal domain-containing protein [Flavitalea sp.]
AIYGSHAWAAAPPIKKETNLFYSTKGKDLFAMVVAAENKPLIVDGVKKPASVKLLGYNGPVKFSYSGNKLTIIMPAVGPAQNLSNDAWVFRISGAL